MLDIVVSKRLMEYVSDNKNIINNIFKPQKTLRAIRGISYIKDKLHFNKPGKFRIKLFRKLSSDLTNVVIKST